MLEEVNVNLVFGLAGYNIRNLDRSDFIRFMEQNIKAYVTNKDIGIASNVTLLLESKE